MLPRNADDKTSTSSTRWALFGVLAIAIVVHLLALYQFREVEILHGDEGYYAHIASSIASGNGYPGSLRPPLYGAFMAGVFSVFGENRISVQYVQIALSLLTVGLIFSIATSRFGSRAGFISGLACALSPALVHYSHFLWSETLNAALLVLLFWLLDRYDRAPRLAYAVLAGSVLGLNALTRETWIYFSLFVAAWIFARAGSKWRSAIPTVAALLVSVVVTVAPWTMRNWIEHERFVPISTNHWFPMALGNLYPSNRWYLGTDQDREDGYTGGGSMVRQARQEAPIMRTEFESEEYWKGIALSAIAAEQPMWIFKKAVRNTARLFFLRNQELRFLALGWFRPAPHSAYALIISSVVGTLATMALGIVGLWLVRDRGLKTLVVLAILQVMAVHVLAVAVPRFLVPILPLFALYVGPLLVGATDPEKPARWRLLGAFACVAAYLLIPLPSTVRFLEVVWSAAGSLPG